MSTVCEGMTDAETQVSNNLREFDLCARASSHSQKKTCQVKLDILSNEQRTTRLHLDLVACQYLSQCRTVQNSIHACIGLPVIFLPLRLRLFSADPSFCRKPFSQSYRRSI